MDYRVELTARALAEAREVRDWIARESPERAARWYQGLLDKIETLAMHPRRFALAPENDDFDVEIRQLLYGRRHAAYRVLFTIREDIVVILYIRHGARAPLSSSEGIGEVE